MGTPTPWGIAVNDQSSPWFVEQGSNRIARLSGGTVTEWPIPTLGCVAWNIILDPNGNPWFTEKVGNKIAKFEFQSGKFYEWTLPVPTDTIEPRGLVWNTSNTGQQFGDLWFTEYSRNRIGHIRQIDVDKVTFSFYNISAPSRGPLSIAISPIDHSLWWTEYLADKIGSLKLLENGTGLFRHYPITTHDQPWGIAVDPEGFVWVTESGKSAIGRLDPASGEYVTFAIPTSESQPHELVLELSTAIPPRLINVWFTEFNKDKIGKYVPGSNVFFEYPIITSGGRPHGIALQKGILQPDIWFTEPFGDKIGRLTRT